ncbi:hypothetical protein [Occultella gossypii]|uniref:Uncharacterized protein n=1 Tax=Occultella gossypii TaxID=2800820 RepID=A0ABS7SC06_9MICO|nr:hypothetical protein [Occultella gossypii]MBZ2197275.1 hypothetical protein [Occultella gossypii]
MARWCLTTDQPVASWMVLTELERREFYDEAVKMNRRIREGARHAR